MKNPQIKQFLVILSSLSLSLSLIFLKNIKDYDACVTGTILGSLT